MKTIRCFTLIAATTLSIPFLFTLYARAGDKPMNTSKYFVYIGTYTQKTSKGIYAYRFDAATGKLTPLGLAAESAEPSFWRLIPAADSFTPSMS